MRRSTADDVESVETVYNLMKKLCRSFEPKQLEALKEICTTEQMRLFAEVAGICAEDPS